MTFRRRPSGCGRRLSDVDEILLRESLLEPADPDEVQRISRIAVAEHEPRNAR